MIGKIGRTGRSFHGLIRYLTQGPRQDKRNPARVAWTATRNLLIDDPRRAVTVMRATADKSVRVRKPVYHFTISWTEDENPAPDVMQEITDAALEDLGLADHQAVLVAHNDTRHPHVHVVVNRVLAESGKAWRTSMDYSRLERCLARQSRERGYEPVVGPHNDPESRHRRQRRMRTSERRMADSTGAIVRQRFALDRIRELAFKLGPAFGQAASWSDLDAGLAAEGLHLQRKGQGLVLTDGTGEMKLSDLGKGIRLPALEARFGSPYPVRTRERETGLKQIRKRRRDRDK